jgi:dTDP-4-amino-4,6-dideoxygalactose transaminase
MPMGSPDIGLRERAGDLAILDRRPPLFDAPLHVGAPNIGDRERLRARIDDILDRRWLTNGGRYVHELEERLAAMIGVRHCIAMANATIALEIAIRASGMTGEVIVPAFTFVATAHALQWQGITPVFCDIDPRTHTIEPAHAESLIGDRTTGIIGVHLWGRPAPVRALEALAERHGLTLLFDAAHALGCTAEGRMIGRFGRAEVLSFHATKFVNAAEGGAIVTDDDALAGRARAMRNVGFHDYDLVESIGTNGKMTEISAAMGITSLESIREFVERNRDNQRAWRRALEGVPGLSVMRYDESERCNWQYVVVEVDEDAPLTRDELLRVLVAERVMARRYFHPGCHRMEPYASMPAGRDARVPVTERVAARVLQLPTGTAVGEAQIAQVGAVIRMAMERAEEVRHRLGPIDPRRVYEPEP